MVPDRGEVLHEGLDRREVIFTETEREISEHSRSLPAQTIL